VSPMYSIYCPLGLSNTHTVHSHFSIRNKGDHCNGIHVANGTLGELLYDCISRMSDGSG